MRAIAASIPLSQASALMGRPWGTDAGQDGLSDIEFATVRALFNRRLQMAWEQPVRWPDLRLIERRLRELVTWYIGSNYVRDNRVFDEATNRCYVCMGNSSGQTPGNYPQVWAPLQDNAGIKPYVTLDDTFGQGDRVLVTSPDPAVYGYYYARIDGASAFILSGGTGPDFIAQWYKLPAWNPEFPLVDGTQTDIGEVYTAWASFPLPPARGRPIDFELNSNGLRLQGILVANPKEATWINYSLDGSIITTSGLTSPGSCYIDFKPRCPIVTGDPWSSTDSYVSGEQVYFDSGVSGDWYTANTAISPAQSPATNPTFWDKIEIPYLFGPFLQWGIYADWLDSDGQMDKASMTGRMADELLQQAIRTVIKTQRQTSQTKVQTR
jgi:hypothetical protein